jgi:hypothetical protein
MDESEWLACADPRAMLECLRRRASDRKLRLFLCGCLRLIPLPDGRTAIQALAEPCGRVLETAERFADGNASDAERAEAEQVAREAEYRAEGRLYAADFTIAEEAYDESEWTGPSAARYWHRPPKMDSVSAAWEVATAGRLVHALDASIRDGSPTAEDPWHWQFGPEWFGRPDPLPVRSRCAQLLRDLFGNPFRPASMTPAWLTWNHGTVPAIARHIYEDRAFHDLPILADALEDAGCTDAAILGHCRGPGEHVRGCWVVDLLLGQS